jgi:hypothetical protein
MRGRRAGVLLAGGAGAEGRGGPDSDMVAWSRRRDVKRRVCTGGARGFDPDMLVGVVERWRCEVRREDREESHARSDEGGALAGVRLRGRGDVDSYYSSAN